MIDEIKAQFVKTQGNAADDILPVDWVIDFLLDNKDEDRLIQRFLSILKPIKEYGFIMDAFRSKTDIQQLENIRAVQTLEPKVLVPNQANRDDIKMFICECIGLMTRKLTDMMFYSNDRPKSYFLQKFTSKSLLDIVSESQTHQVQNKSRIPR